MDIILDDEWIKEFDETDKLYKDFYKDDLFHVNLTMIYLNQENEIEKIKQEPFLLTNKNTLSYEEFFGLLKTNSIDNNKMYSILSIIKYNFDIEADELNTYLSSQYETGANYLSIIKNIDTVHFQKTINMFQDLNEIIFIYHEKTKSKSKTFAKANENIDKNNHSHSKRVSKHYRNKTIKNKI